MIRALFLALICFNFFPVGKIYAENLTQYYRVVQEILSGRTTIYHAAYDFNRDIREVQRWIDHYLSLRAYAHREYRIEKLSPCMQIQYFVDAYQSQNYSAYHFCKIYGVKYTTFKGWFKKCMEMEKTKRRTYCGVPKEKICGAIFKWVTHVQGLYTISYSENIPVSVLQEAIRKYRRFETDCFYDPDEQGKNFRKLFLHEFKEYSVIKMAQRYRTTVAEILRWKREIQVKNSMSIARLLN